MSLAKKIIDIIEGFKLGSLGVNPTRVPLTPASAFQVHTSEPQITTPPWDFKKTNLSVVWREYARPSWRHVLGISDTGTHTVKVWLMADFHDPQDSLAYVEIGIETYKGDKEGMRVSDKEFAYVNTWNSLEQAKNWIQSQVDDIKRNGLAWIHFPHSWNEVAKTKPLPKPAPTPKPTPTSSSTGPIVAARKPGGSSLQVPGPDYGHSKDRVDSMDAKKLLTRLGRITKAQKLLDTIIALENSGDSSKVAVAKDYVRKLETQFGYTVHRR